MKAGAVLNKYFNTNGDPSGYVKRTNAEFLKELKALTPDEKRQLATAAAAEMGVELDA